MVTNGQVAKLSDNKLGTIPGSVIAKLVLCSGKTSKRLERAHRSQDSAASLGRMASDHSIGSSVHRRDSREPLNAAFAGRSSHQLESHSPKPVRAAPRSMSRQTSASAAPDATTLPSSGASPIGPFRPAQAAVLEAQHGPAANVVTMQRVPSAKPQLPRLASTRSSNAHMEFRPGPGEQGINSLAQWMAAAEDRRASTVASTVASSTQEATSVDSPLASQDGNNLSGIHHLPSDSSVHAMPESAPVLNPLRLALHHSRGSAEMRRSAATEEAPTSSSDPFLPPPEMSAQSPTPIGSRRVKHTLAELEVVSRFLRTSKIPVEAIGGVLSDNCQDSQDLLDVYTGQFDFQGLEIDEALRGFLEQVWLHGESQKIQRILAVFAIHYYTQNPSVFNSQDAATTMAFAVIMLNTNLHNPKVPKQDRMSLDAFFRQLRDVNGGQNFPEDFLEGVYTRISMREFKSPVGPSMEFRMQAPRASNGLMGFLKPDKAGSRSLAPTTSLRASEAGLTNRGSLRIPEAIPSGRAIYSDDMTGPALTGDSATVAEKSANGARDPGDAFLKASRRSLCCCFSGA
ncbi:hypothetical protein WJX84_006374 [Apatococcus fuscideae]|uniref:SEC7 domain-containing protein n=1 Tax=Apatococcus fuscideae TaxID=2026836 RepID=A0AAW1TAX9_9CHLO